MFNLFKEKKCLLVLNDKEINCKSLKSAYKKTRNFVKDYKGGEENVIKIVKGEKVHLHLEMRHKDILIRKNDTVMTNGEILDLYTTR